MPRKKKETAEAVDPVADFRAATRRLARLKTKVEEAEKEVADKAEAAKDAIDAAAEGK